MLGFALAFWAADLKNMALFLGHAWVGAAGWAQTWNDQRVLGVKDKRGIFEREA